MTLALREGRTTLRNLHQVSPLRALFPTPERDEALTLALVNTGGGLAGGDHLRIMIEAEVGARATISAPAAEKIYRSLGPPSRIDCALQLGAGAVMEWIPQETILFDGARLQRRISADLAAGARLLAAETLVFGRAARGEAFTRGALRDSWRIRRDGVLVWADGVAVDPPRALGNRFGFAGAESLATLLFCGDEAPAMQALLREAGAQVTLPTRGLVVARWLGAARDVRRGLGSAIGLVRAAVFGLPARLPRLWTA
ncbi:urease accessory protein UreD [Plastoroseomonas arctica]|uniref:Urease accessory protein UreD n=1 Tax=Plastoroseomonas arctica TaxID=1509237 RepID=A0AAF1KM23_9PROT|nr:urease accessory protein UreD [Plastoroseomonas arctica]